MKLYTRVPLGDIIGITKGQEDHRIMNPHLLISFSPGAYIISPLEESSRDPEENAGFVITWSSSNQESRVTSYSVRNSVGPGVDLLQGSTDVQTPPASPGFSIGPMKIRTGPRRNPTMSGPGSGGNALSNILSGNAFGIGNSGSVDEGPAGQEHGKLNFAAFKVLPVDPGRSHARRGTSYNTSTSRSRASESDEGYEYGDLQNASTCREAVDVIVDCIQRGCLDVGGGRRMFENGDEEHGFVTERDVVSLAEAQRMTSVYAKMEYGVKRLLWLGG